MAVTPPQSGSPQRPADSPPPSSFDPHETDMPAPVTPSPAGSSDGGIHLKPGERPLPEYELVHKLGKGGFGEVWKATGPGGFAVALKFIHLGDLAGSIEMRALDLMREIRYVHLLGQFGAWQKDGYLIVAMELGDQTLLQRLQDAVRQGLPGIPPEPLLEYMREAAKGLDYLHQLGVQHRDVKPANFLLVGGGVKVADYGLAKLLEHTVTAASGGMTPAYAAPELFENKISLWSDQYSLAVSYCQLRGNRLPFEGNFASIMAGHLTKPPDLTMLPEAERPAAARALAKKPEERWPTCRAFVEALAAGVAKRAPVVEATPATPPEMPATPTRPTYAPDVPRPAVWRRRPTVVGLLLLSALMASLIAALILLFTNAGQEGSGGLAQWDPPAPPAKETHQPPPDPRPVLPVAAPKPEPVPKEKAPSAREITNSIGMKLALIPPGKFLMGSPKEEEGRGDDEDQHEVEITKPFYLGVYEVTQKQYTEVMGQNPSWFSPQSGGKEKVKGLDTSQFPVEMVSWEDAVEFCRKLAERPDERHSERTYRLPTEAEWEYACRGGARESTPFHFGETLSPDQANFNGRLLWTTTVGSYPPNAFGLYDMHGNVRQWCQDRYDPDYYKHSPQQDPPGPETGTSHVQRGGSWRNGSRYCRAACRHRDPPGANSTGFRVACRLGVGTP